MTATHSGLIACVYQNHVLVLANRPIAFLYRRCVWVIPVLPPQAWKRPQQPPPRSVSSCTSYRPASCNTTGALHCTAVCTVAGTVPGCWGDTTGDRHHGCHAAQAVTAMVTCGLGGAGAKGRLGALARRLRGTPEQVAALLQDRDGASLQTQPWRLASASDSGFAAQC